MPNSVATDMARPPATGRGAASRLLVVGREHGEESYVLYTLKRAGYDVRAVASGEAALREIDDDPPDLVLLGLELEGLTGHDVLSRLRGTSSRVPVIALDAQASPGGAEAARRAGALDVLSGSAGLERLEHSVERTLELRDLGREVERLRLELDQLRLPDIEIIGRSSGLRETLELLEKVVHTDLTVLLQGETGTGREFIARWLHAGGPRREGPFLTLGCSGTPDLLLECELFGSARGAFTGATSDRAGKLEAARGGTLLVNEICEMSETVQAKLLHALEEGAIYRLGSAVPVSLDVRLVCTSSRDLEREMQRGRFRRDLYYRLAVFPVTIPPLRSRREDVPELCRSILASVRPAAAPVIHPAAMAQLEAYDWPENVRELRSTLHRAVVLAGSGPLRAEHLPLAVRDAASLGYAPAGARGSRGSRARGEHDAGGEALPTLEQVERAHIHRTLQACGGNLSRTARVLGIGRTTLYRKLQRDESAAPTVDRCP